MRKWGAAVQNKLFTCAIWNGWFEMFKDACLLIVYNDGITQLPATAGPPCCPHSLFGSLHLQNSVQFKGTLQAQFFNESRCTWRQNCAAAACQPACSPHGTYRSRTAHSACARQNSPGLSFTGLLNCAFSTQQKLQECVSGQDTRMSSPLQASAHESQPPACPSAGSLLAPLQPVELARTCDSSRAWLSKATTPQCLRSCWR